MPAPPPESEPAIVSALEMVIGCICIAPSLRRYDPDQVQRVGGRATLSALSRTPSRGKLCGKCTTNAAAGSCRNHPRDGEAEFRAGVGGWRLKPRLETPAAPRSPPARAGTAGETQSGVDAGCALSLGVSPGLGGSVA